jgi:hypothetical protein
MKPEALDTLVNRIADTFKAGASPSDVATIFAHPEAQHELFHCASRVNAGQDADTARLQTLVFGLTVHGGAGLKEG